MSITCKNCGQDFEITDDDLVFYEKVSPLIDGKRYDIPPPTHCPTCRHQRRHAYRNEFNMYYRKCDKTGKQILSIYHPDGPVTVYEHKEWWGDDWDPLSYGHDYDFSRPFFDQFEELLKEVPHMNIAVSNVENCDYCNLLADCKNSYLLFESSHVEDALYSYWLQKCKDCCDSSFSHECELCYEIDNCYNCYELKWSRNCNNCSDSSFLLDCIGCKNCLYCVNLHHKEYCIMNQQYTKDEYEQKIKECDFHSHAMVEKMKQQFEEFSLKYPRKYMNAIQHENCTGNFVQESKNCHSCFHAHESEDCKYGEHVWRNAKDCMDVITAGRDAFKIYESSNTNIGAGEDAFTHQCWGSFNTYYSSECCYCKNCFGCVSLKSAEYCIFNKQYTKEEYETLVPKIIQHMMQTKEWGEFFPASISMFGYNESMANEYYPLTKEQVVQKRWQWLDQADASDLHMGPPATLPDSSLDATEETITQIFHCQETKKPYKVIAQELDLYKRLKVPIPRLSPNKRHRIRMEKRNPLQLWDRKCTKCSADVQTTYAPDKPEIVYCENCYYQTVS